MSNAKHTPGEWKIGGASGCDVYAGGRHVCYTGPINRFDYPRHCANEDRANARLIAAAPELLEALETLASEEWRDDSDPILDAARIKARAAIAKAKGQA